MEADNEIDDSIKGKKVTNKYKQNTVSNGFNIVFEINDVLRIGYFSSGLGYENVDWFVDQVINLDNQMNFYFKNTKQDFILTGEEEESFKNFKNCRFREESMYFYKISYDFQLTGKYGGLFHQIWNINITQKQSKFTPIVSHNFSSYDFHLFFKKLKGKRKNEVKLDIIPKTNEEYISVTVGSVRFIDSCRFLPSSMA